MSQRVHVLYQTLLEILFCEKKWPKITFLANKIFVTKNNFDVKMLRLIANYVTTHTLRTVLLQFKF